MSGWQAFLLWIYGAAIAQGLFLTVALSGFRVRNTAARNLLVAIVVVTTLMLTGNFLSELGIPSGAVGMAIEFAYGPLMYLFARSITEPGASPTRRDALHFLPLAVALLLLSWVQLAGGIGGVAEWAWPLRVWLFIKFPYFCVYAFFAVQVLRQHKTDAAGRRRRPIVWISRWILASTVVVSIMYFDFALLMAGLPAFPEPDQIGGLLLTAMIYSVAYFALVSQHLLQSGGAVPISGDGQLRELADRIDTFLDREQPFRDPDFSIEQLGHAVSAKPERVGAALRYQHDTGFRELVNEKRLAAFIALAEDSGNQGRGILDLAYEAGFSSKATFYRVFKAAQGVSPQEYRKELSTDSA